MGIDDRDYMRERHRTNAKGFKPGGGKSRPRLGDVFFNYSTGRWDHADSLNLQRGRITGIRHRLRGGQSAFLRPGPMTALAVVLLFSFQGVRIFDDFRQNGYLPEFGTTVPFPESGEFKVRGRYASGGTARFTITAGERNAVVQLVGRDGIPVFMTFVRMNEMAAVLAPHGTWTLRLLEGDTWYGEEELFGLSSVVEDSRERLTFGNNGGHIIDLRRRFNGNLETNTNWLMPDLEGN